MRTATRSGLLLVALLAGACGENTGPDSRPSALDLPDQILSDFEVEMTRGELRSATIRASRGVIYRKRDSMQVTDLLARIYDADGRESSLLTADSGLIRERQRRRVANGRVHVQSRDSLHLRSDSLFWYGQLHREPAARRAAGADDEELRYMVAKSNVHLVTRDSVQLWTDTLLWNDIRQTLATDAHVTIVRRGEDTLRGRGLRSDDQLKRITIQESASGRITSPPR